MVREGLIGVLAVIGSLLLAGSASAESCIYEGGNLGSWHEPLHWDCGHVPGAGDSAVVPAFTEVSVAADASAGGLFLGGPASALTFSNEATLAAGTLTAASATLRGAGHRRGRGSVPQGGHPRFGHAVPLRHRRSRAERRQRDGRRDASRSVRPATRRAIPPLHINADFTIAEGSSTFSVFNCSSSGARIRVGPAGHLIKAASGQTTSDTAIDNDGTLTVQAGTLLLTGGTANALGATSDGDYVADEGATLAFQGGSPPAIGASGRLGGAGTIHVNTIDMDMLAGSVLDPAVLQLSGVLRLRGTDPVTLPDLELTDGVIDSDRPVAVDDMDVTAGRLQRDFTLTVRPGGSFTKTSAGTLFVGNNGAFGSADLVLDADASLDDGTFCVARTGTDPDVPGLFINQDFTIGSGAPSGAFQCGPQFDTFDPRQRSRRAPEQGRVGDDELQRSRRRGRHPVRRERADVRVPEHLRPERGRDRDRLRRDAAGVADADRRRAARRRAGERQRHQHLGNGATGLLAGDVDRDGQLHAGRRRHARDRPRAPAAVTTSSPSAARPRSDGTLAAVPATGFDPAPAAAFPVLTSGSRTRRVRDAHGHAAAGRQAARARVPGRAGLRRAPGRDPADLVVGDCDDLALAPSPRSGRPHRRRRRSAATPSSCPRSSEVAGDLIITDNDSAEAISLGELGSVGGDLTITGNDTAEAISLGELGSVGGDLTITGNDSAEAIGLGDLDSVGGDLTITDNGDATVALGSPDQVGGDLTLDTTGDGPIALGDGSPAGDLDLDTTGYGEVSGATAAGSTTIANDHPEALMRVVLPAGAFSAPVPFAITRLDPAALPPEGNVDPVVAYAFEFGVPTLDSPAELSFAVRLSGLDQGTRDALLAALADGRATLATRGAGAYQTFPLCAAGVAPSADGCVRVEHAGDVVRFTGVVGHFSTWAVAIVAKPPSTTATPTPTPGPPPAAGSRPSAPARWSR